MTGATAGMRAVSRWLYDPLLELVFPQFCKECDERLFYLDNGFFCADCWERVPRITAPYCSCCGRPHARILGFGAPVLYPCADCRDSPNKHITEIRAPAVYEGALETAIKLLKFHARVRLAKPLAEMMSEFVGENMEANTYTHLMPVPLHRVRQRERGFNQSQLIARELHATFPNAAFDDQLSRIRPTLTQSRLRGDARHTNVRGAFAYLGPDIKDARVLLIDDVVTTAGTVTECARILRKAGAARVDVLAAALTVPDAAFT